VHTAGHNLQTWSEIKSLAAMSTVQQRNTTTTYGSGVEKTFNDCQSVRKLRITDTQTTQRVCCLLSHLTTHPLVKHAVLATIPALILVGQQLSAALPGNTVAATTNAMPNINVQSQVSSCSSSSSSRNSSYFYGLITV